MARVQEKRQAPRLTTVVPVNCRITSSGADPLPSYRGGPETKGNEFTARTVNISRDGVLINSDVDLLPRTELELTLAAPTDGRPIKITAEVAWSRRNAMNLFGRFAAGLKVRKMAERDRAVLTEFFKPL